LLTLLLILTGCPRNFVDNTIEDKTNLKIMILERGYGTEWLKEIAKSFKNKNPGIVVDIQCVANGESLGNSFDSGERANDIDLYFTNDASIFCKAISYSNKFNGDDKGTDGIYRHI
jgi:ABC-type glycerol-3-phosphate transport system substrate-binding protein